MSDIMLQATRSLQCVLYRTVWHMHNIMAWWWIFLQCFWSNNIYSLLHWTHSCCQRFIYCDHIGSCVCNIVMHSLRLCPQCLIHSASIVSGPLCVKQVRRLLCSVPNRRVMNRDFPSGPEPCVLTSSSFKNPALNGFCTCLALSI